MTKATLLAAMSMTVSALLAPSIADACSFPAYEVKIVTYWSAGASFDHTDPRCDNPGACMLNGWLIAPKTGTHLRAVVFAHGSAGVGDTDKQSLQEYCEIEHRLLTAGYVVFLPFRRGVVDDTTPEVSGIPLTSYEAQDSTDPSHPRGYFANTGWAAADWAAWVSGNDHSIDTNVGNYINYLSDEASDMQAAMYALTNQMRNGVRLVDNAHVAFVGHSMGGAFATIVSTFAFDAGTQPVAFASLSGAGMSWYGSHWWADTMDGNATQHRKVIFFQRVLDESDPSLGPVDFQSAVQPANAAAGHNGGSVLRTYQALNLTNSYCHTNYPTLTDDEHYWCTHGTFVHDPNYVDLWWPNFMQFLTNHG